MHIFSTEGWIEKCWTFVFVLHVTFVRKEQRIEVLYLGKHFYREKETVLYGESLGKWIREKPGKEELFCTENTGKENSHILLLFGDGFNTFD